MPFFTTPTGIAVIAAASSFIAGLLGAGISAWTTRSTHAERLAADERLAAKKFAYEQQQAVFKRRFELAEQLLSDAYKFRLMMRYVRNGFSLEGEGESRDAGEPETEKVKQSRDRYFVPVKRLRDEDGFIAEMFARRTTSQAHFGSDADKAFALFHGALHRVRVASSLLIEWVREHENVDRETIESLRRDIWQPMAKIADKDEIGNAIEEGVQTIERLCTPVLKWEGEV